jgi:hypothetical protein
MQLYFRPTTTKMLGNLKIFTIAVLMRSVLGRRFNVVQYEALFLLVAGERTMRRRARACRAGRAAQRDARAYLSRSRPCSHSSGRKQMFSPALAPQTRARARDPVLPPPAATICDPAPLSPAGITVNQLQSCGGHREALPAGALVPAVLCVAGSVTVPAAASVYNEYALKRHMDTSVHLQVGAAGPAAAGMPAQAGVAACGVARCGPNLRLLRE